MRSGVRFWGATTIALVASGAANSAECEPAVQLPWALWSWSGGYSGGHVGVGYGQKSFSNPHGPSVYGGVVDSPVFLAGGQIGYNWQKNSWGVWPQTRPQRCYLQRHKYLPRSLRHSAERKLQGKSKRLVPGAGRLGYAFGAQGHTLAYLKRGVAWQNNQGEVINNNELANVGDGALDFYKALGEVVPGTRHQPCWMHKTMNSMDKVHSLCRPL